MGSRKDFETLIPDKIRNKFHNEGVPFSELRQASKTPENLIEAIYRYWRGGNVRIERTGTESQQKRKTFLTATVLVYCRMTAFILKIQPSGICGRLQHGT